MEPDAFQLCWSELPSAWMAFEVAGRLIEVDATPPQWYRRLFRRRLPVGLGGPGALAIEELEPRTWYDVCLSGKGYPRRLVARVRTPEAPPGRELCRFATVSDCHLGERTFGPLRLLHDPVPPPAGLAPYPLRCAAAAIAEARRWGAGLMVVKGDLTQGGRPGEVRSAVEMLRGAGMPVAVVLGNHDVRGAEDTFRVLGESSLLSGEEPAVQDLPGLRLILGHSPVPNRHSGRLPVKRIEQLARLAGQAPALGSLQPGPAALVLHHPLQRWPVETHYPPSICWRDSRRLAAALLEANPNVVILSGHTHRNRFYQAAGVPVAEVGSTKDYPGQWAGYRVYEGGVAQVVRRVAHPDAIAWNETTRRALGGLWGAWSPGTLEQRCWGMSWSTDLSPSAA